MSIKRTQVLGLIVSASLAGGIGSSLATPETTDDGLAGAKGSAAAHAKGSAGQPMREPTDYKLTPERLAKFLKAEKKLAAINESDPKLIKAIAVHSSEGLREDWIRRTESRPKVLEAFTSAGTNPHDYIQMASAIARAFTVHNLNMNKQPVAKELADTVPSENILFVANHQTELVAWKGGPQAQAIRPNTLEDIYAPPPTATASTTAPPSQPQPAGSAAPENTAAPPPPK